MSLSLLETEAITYPAPTLPACMYAVGLAAAFVHALKMFVQLSARNISFFSTSNPRGEWLQDKIVLYMFLEIEDRETELSA